MDNIEQIRNKLNLELRSLLSVIDIIDGKKNKYSDYKEGQMNEQEFLEQQLILVVEAQTRLIEVFK